MIKSVNKVADVLTLKVNKGLNWREDIGYDLESMVSDIIRDRRILDDIHVLDPLECQKFGLEGGTVLKGSRRTLAGQSISTNPDSPVEVVTALKKTSIKVVSGFETVIDVRTYMLDHGSTKGLSRTEIVLAVWSLHQAMLSEADIQERMYQVLASYTKNFERATQISQITDKRRRKAELSTWLHGTVGGYLLAVAQFGEAIRDQFILYSRKEDGTIKEDDEKRMVLVFTRPKVSSLSVAKNADKNSAKGWKPVNSIKVNDDGTVEIEGGGEKFNELLTEYCKEHVLKVSGNKPKQRPTAKTLESVAETMKTQVVKAALLAGAGKPSESLAELDLQCQRNELVIELLKKTADRLLLNKEGSVTFTNERLAELLNTLAVSSVPAVTLYLASI